MDPIVQKIRILNPSNRFASAAHATFAKCNKKNSGNNSNSCQADFIWRKELEQYKYIKESNEGGKLMQISDLVKNMA